MIRKILSVGTGAALAVLVAGSASARIPEPDHIFYGTTSVYGSSVTTGVVTALVGTSLVPVATAALTPAGLGHYVLRIPIDSVEPQDPGTARPGESVRFFLNGALAGEATVGERGEAQNLDLDKNFNDLLSLNDVAVVEGNSGTTQVEFTLSLSEVSQVPITVQLSTVNGTAVAGSDFAPLTGSAVTIPAGVLSVPVRVSVNGDLLNEANETFYVDIVNSGAARAGDPRGVATITNDDTVPTLAASSVTLVEGNPGSNPIANFQVVLSAPSGQAVQVQYATVNGTGTAGSDFTAASGTLLFPVGTTTRAVPVTILPDVAYERHETYTLALSNPVNALVDASGGRGVIINDDPKSADANGDGKTDILWQNDATGALAAWLMDGVHMTSIASLVPASFPVLDWKIVATGDFNGDGVMDLLWKNRVTGVLATWNMDGLTRTGGAAIDTVTDPNWRVRAADDFDGDGKVDILWQNATSGVVALWFLDGVQKKSIALTDPSQVPTAWTIVGTGDFNGDLKPDILWQHDTGLLAVWFMDGALRTGYAFLSPSQLTDRRWKVAGTGDYNGDGKVDLLLRHEVDGRLVVWFMDGTARTAEVSVTPGAVTDLNWQIVGPK